MTPRAIVLIDGNNWYHSLRDCGLHDLGRLDYAKISQKLVGPRDWLATRYYIGQVRQQGTTRLYAEQRRFLSKLKSTDRRISYHLGRIEPRTVEARPSRWNAHATSHAPHPVHLSGSTPMCLR